MVQSLEGLNLVLGPVVVLLGGLGLSLLLDELDGALVLVSDGSVGGVLREGDHPPAESGLSLGALLVGGLVKFDILDGLARAAGFPRAHGGNLTVLDADVGVVLEGGNMIRAQILLYKAMWLSSRSLCHWLTRLPTITWATGGGLQGLVSTIVSLEGHL